MCEEIDYEHNDLDDEITILEEFNTMCDFFDYSEYKII